MTPAQANRPPQTTSKTQMRSCGVRCPSHQPKASPSVT